MLRFRHQTLDRNNKGKIPFVRQDMVYKCNLLQEELEMLLRF